MLLNLKPHREPRLFEESRGLHCHLVLCSSFFRLDLEQESSGVGVCYCGLQVESLGLDVHLLPRSVLLLAADGVVVAELVGVGLLVGLMLVIVEQGLGIWHTLAEANSSGTPWYLDYILRLRLYSVSVVLPRLIAIQ